MNAFEDASVLVVGGAGFVGSNLCLKILNHPVKNLTIVDNLLSADISNVSQDERVSFLSGSIADDAILNQLDDYDYIFHLATYHGNQSSIANPLKDHDNNTYTTLKLCEHFKNSDRLKKLVYAGAGCTVAKKTFDDVEATDEEASVSLYLDSPYQISKIIGEFYGNYYLLRHDLPFVKARFQNVYGPREILGAGLWRGTPATVWRNVVPTFIWQALHSQALTVENGGVATRDFIYVEDIVDGLICCAIAGESGGVYNLASGVETSILHLAQLVNKLTNNETEIALTPAREWDRSGKRFGTTEKAQQEIGFRAEIALEQGVKQTIDWTIKNQKMIESCINKHGYYMKELLHFTKESEECVAL